MKPGKMLMLGWELPPVISGGLGVATQGIADGLTALGYEIDFLLPKKRRAHLGKSFKVLDASRMKLPTTVKETKKIRTETIREVELGMKLLPYLPPEIFEIAREKQIAIEEIIRTEEVHLLDMIPLTGSYETNLQNELAKYSLLAAQTVLKKKYQLVHAHDWLTFKAGRLAAKEAGIPLYTHCHSTEYDRNGGCAHPVIVEEERLGFQASEKIFCVSQRLKETVVEKYGIPAAKIVVVPNAPDVLHHKPPKKTTALKQVLFIGRFTYQKSPLLFVDVARDLVSRGNDVHFTMIGDGYLRPDVERKVQQMNLSKYFTFPGFVSREETMEKLAQADVLIVPSSSEPFGLVILEAIMNEVPVVAAAGTGVSEFIKELPEVPLWDQFNYVKLVEKVLTQSKFKKQVVTSCLKSAEKLSWSKSASIIAKSYL